MKAIDIRILQAVFKKHNKLTSRYSWEPHEIVEYERLMKELNGVETVYIEEEGTHETSDRP